MPHSILVQQFGKPLLYRQQQHILPTVIPHFHIHMFEDNLREFCFFFLLLSHTCLTHLFFQLLSHNITHAQNLAHFHPFYMRIAHTHIPKTDFTIVCSGRFNVNVIQCVSFHFKNNFHIYIPVSIVQW